MRRLAIVLLAACRGTPTTTRVPHNTAEPVAGCPTAKDVYALESARAPVSGAHVGYQLPLVSKDAPPSDSPRELARIDAAAARAVGVPTPPSPIWIVAPGAAPCRATIGSYYATPDLVGNLTYGVELEGCPAPPKYQSAVAIAVERPGACKLAAPTTVAERLGSTSAEHWTRPTTGTPMPPAFAKVIPSHACEAPACETLWNCRGDRARRQAGRVARRRQLAAGRQARNVRRGVRVATRVVRRHLRRDVEECGRAVAMGTRGRRGISAAADAPRRRAR